MLPIGEYEFDVTYINDKTVTKLFTIPAPGSTSADSMSFVYTEDYPYTPGSGYAALPKRANISNCIFSSGSTEVTIEFSVDDSNIYNCVIWFYNSSGNSVGGSGWFRDFSTGSFSSVININGGAGLYTDGTTNSIIFPVSSIDYSSGYTSSDLVSVRIVLTDGKQYINSDANSYDTRSISAKNYIR